MIMMLMIVIMMMMILIMMMMMIMMIIMIMMVVIMMMMILMMIMMIFRMTGGSGGQDCASLICDIAPFSRECKQVRKPGPTKEFQRMKVRAVISS